MWAEHHRRNTPKRPEGDGRGLMPIFRSSADRPSRIQAVVSPPRSYFTLASSINQAIGGTALRGEGHGDAETEMRCQVSLGDGEGSW